MKVNNRSYIWSVFALFELNCLAAASGPAFDLADPDKKWHEDVLHYTNGGMYGWTFTILQPVTVTGLGWYDNGGDGLFHPHEIGIWPGGLYSGGVSSELLGSITIPSSTAAPLESYYRKLDLPAELTLSPGEYTVAGTHIVDNEDPVSYYDVSISVPPLRRSQICHRRPGLRVWGWVPTSGSHCSQRCVAARPDAICGNNPGAFDISPVCSGGAAPDTAAYPEVRITTGMLIGDAERSRPFGVDRPY